MQNIENHSAQIRVLDETANSSQARVGVLKHENAKLIIELAELRANNVDQLNEINRLKEELERKSKIKNFNLIFISLLVVQIANSWNCFNSTSVLISEKEIQ